jgi:tetratricopeptide (TPR) repeat protein
MDAFAEIFDITLLATGALIILITMFGAYLHSSRRDPCLKAFEHYHITLERSDGKVIWGEMELEPTGFELLYRDSVQDSNHLESSYVLYGSEFGEIQAIYRYVDDLSDEDRLQRERDLKRYFRPGPIVRLLRALQHFFTLASDSLTEVLGMVMGRLRKPAGRYIGDVTDDQFMRFSTALVGSVGTTYDPILERFIGSKVVIELLEGDASHEHVALFKNYSPDFFELLDVQYPQPRELPLSGEVGAVSGGNIVAVREGNVLFVTNNTQQPVLILSLRLSHALDAEEEMLNVVVDGGETVELRPDELTDEASLMVRVVRELDLIVPRTRCIIRHRADRYESSLIPEIIFDLGVMLRGKDQLDAKIERLRQRLEDAPNSAVMSSNLGALLMKQQKYAEASGYLERAYAARYSLPDNGKRTLMLIHELERRTGKGQNRAVSVASAVPSLVPSPPAPPPPTPSQSQENVATTTVKVG